LKLAKVYLSQVMNKRPGRVNVTTEAGFCNFCGRPRNLRHEEHQLGNFIRTVVTCETCHRTLSSTMGVATADATADVEVAAPAQETPAPEPKPAKRAAARKTEPASGKPKATKPRAAKSK
jgi:hypothetical protein